MELLYLKVTHLISILFIRMTNEKKLKIMYISHKLKMCPWKLEIKSRIKPKTINPVAQRKDETSFPSL